MDYDVIIVGKGPAGISCALYLARAKYNVAVIGKDYGALTRAESIENFYGFDKPLRGIELAQCGVIQVEKLGVPVITSEVVGIEQLFPVPQTVQSSEVKKALRFKVVTADGAEYRAYTVLLATGKHRTGLNVPGFLEYQGHGISFCAVCDGFFYRNKKIGVLGNGFYASAELNHLYQLTKDITLFTNGMKLEESVRKTLPQEIAVVNDKITAITGSVFAGGAGRLRAVVTESAEYPLEGLFAAIGTAGAADFAAKLGVQTGSGPDTGTLIVNEMFQTNLAGLYAAGDVIGGYLQVAKAVSDGAHAAKYIVKELRN